MGGKGSGRKPRPLTPEATASTRGGALLLSYAVSRGWGWAELCDHTGRTVWSLYRLTTRAPGALTLAEAIDLHERCGIPVEAWAESSQGAS